MRWGIVAVAVAMLGACTQVRLAQREGCWVRQTESWNGSLKEEIGPCSRQAPAWVPERVTRLVQECVAQADYRWQNEALAAWNRGDPMPAREQEESILRACIDDSTRFVVTENEALQARVQDLTSDRERLQAHNEHLGDILGEAAKKPAGTATAMANARGDGNSSSRNANDSETKHASDFASSPPVVVPGPQPIVVPAPEPVVVRVPEPAPAKKVVRVKAKAPAKPACPEPAPAPAVTTANAVADPGLAQCIAPASGKDDCECPPGGASD